MKRLSFLPTVVALVLGALFIATPFAAAQSMSPTLPGITVVGVGTSSAPADTATIVIMLGTGYGYEDPAMMPVPDIQTTTPASSEEAAAPVIEALVAAGLPADEIEIVANPYSGDYGPYGGPMQVTLRFTVADPTIEGISSMLNAAIPAAHDAGMFVNMTSALYGIDDCSPLIRQAREAAIADGRDQATLQAELLDVSLGDIVASRDTPLNAMMYSGVYAGGYLVNSCTLSGEMDTMTALYSALPFDPAVPAEVSIQVSTELTFGMDMESIATPSS